MFWQSRYSEPVERPAEGRVPEVLPSDVLRQVLYPMVGFCMVVTIYAVAFYHSRMEQPTYYPSEMQLHAQGAGVFADPVEGQGGLDKTAGAGLQDDRR